MYSNTGIVVISGIFAVAIGLAWRWAPDAPYAYLFFMAYTLYMIRGRGGFGDPAVISLFAFGLYAMVPALLTDPSDDDVNWGFDIRGANYIYSVASVAIVAAVCLAFLLFPSPDSAPKSAANRVTSSFYVETLTAVGLSVFLSMIFIALHGVYLIGGGDDAYLDRFTNLGIPGTGILFLSAPLAMAGLCFAMVSVGRFKSPIYLFCGIPYVLLFLALGQRKYLLLPVLLLTFRFFRIRSVWLLGVVLVIAVSGYAAFNYIGFLRESNIALSDALNAGTISLFMDDYQHYMNGEVHTVYVTAAAAYEHAISASFLNDYVGSFLNLLPQFVFGVRTTIDGRFAELVEPSIGELGGGFAFSYFGEAYLVGGTLGIVLATIAMTLFLRCVFVWGKGLKVEGLGGVVSLAMTYYALWYVRTSFAIVVHEICYQIGVILAIYWGIRLSQTRYRRVQAPPLAIIDLPR